MAISITKQPRGKAIEDEARSSSDSKEIRRGLTRAAQAYWDEDFFGHMVWRGRSIAIDIELAEAARTPEERKEDLDRAKYRLLFQLRHSSDAPSVASHLERLARVSTDPEEARRFSGLSEGLSEMLR